MSEYDPISPAGQERKARILAAALTAAAAKRRRRIALRVAAGTVPLLTLAAIVAPKLLPPPPAIPPIARLPSTTRPTPRIVADRAIRVERIPTDPTIADRLAAKPAADLVQRLTDDQLLSSLAQANRPAGLATINDRTLLVFHGPSGTKPPRERNAPEF